MTMTNPRDESLFQHYFSLYILKFDCAQATGTLRWQVNDHVHASSYAARMAVEAHREMFPLPLPQSGDHSGEERPVWQAVISYLWSHDASPEVLAYSFSGEHPPSVVEPEIARLLAARVIYERPDGRVALAARFRTGGRAEGARAVGVALGEEGPAGPSRGSP